MNTPRSLGAMALLATPVLSLSFMSLSQGAAPAKELPLVMKQLTAAEISAISGIAPTSGVHMTTLVGDPTKHGIYTVRVAIAAGTTVQPHMHRDNRSVTVMSGNWQMAYGNKFDAKLLKSLPPGSVYTEPAGQPHFSAAVGGPVVILVTGMGPSDTKFVEK